MSKLSSSRDGTMTANRRKAMPVIDAFIVAAIVAAFVVFAGVLAWAESQTRNLPATGRPVAKAGQQERKPLKAA